MFMEGQGTILLELNTFLHLQLLHCLKVLSLIKATNGALVSLLIAAKQIGVSKFQNDFGPLM